MICLMQSECADDDICSSLSHYPSGYDLSFGRQSLSLACSTPNAAVSPQPLPLPELVKKKDGIDMRPPSPSRSKTAKVVDERERPVDEVSNGAKPSILIKRDIKGANLLVASAGVVKLADFGMAKRVADLSLRGSPYWMAPELMQAVMQKNKSSEVPFALDIWSLGCTIIEMFTGKPPWSEYEGAAAMLKLTRDTPPIPETLSSEGKDILNCCFIRNPAERPTAAALLDHLFLKTSHLGTPSSCHPHGAVSYMDLPPIPKDLYNNRYDQLPFMIVIYRKRRWLPVVDMEKRVCYFILTLGLTNHNEQQHHLHPFGYFGPLSLLWDTLESMPRIIHSNFTTGREVWQALSVPKHITTCGVGQDDGTAFNIYMLF